MVVSSEANLPALCPQARHLPGPLDRSEPTRPIDIGRYNMTTVKSLVAAALLSVFAVASFAQAPVAPMGSHHAVERHHKHHHHHHHAPVHR
jgi:hypothetical protein